MRRVLFVSVCIFLVVGFWGMSMGKTFAQEQGEREGLKERKSVRDRWAGKDRGEIEKLIESLRIVKMTEALNLSEEQSIKVFTKIGQIEREKKVLQKKKIEAIQNLRELIDSGAHEEDVKKSVENIKNLAVSIKDQDETLIKYLEGVLSVEQQAKYILFAEDFQKDIRKMIGHARDGRFKEREGANIPTPKPMEKEGLDIPSPEGMEPEQ